WEALDQLCEKAGLVEAGPRNMPFPGVRPVPALPPGEKKPPAGTLPVVPPAQPGRPGVLNAAGEDEPKTPPTPTPLPLPPPTRPAPGPIPGAPRPIIPESDQSKKEPTPHAASVRILA